MIRTGESYLPRLPSHSDMVESSQIFFGLASRQQHVRNCARKLSCFGGTEINAMAAKKKQPNRYEKIIDRLFFINYAKGMREVEVHENEIFVRS